MSGLLHITLMRMKDLNLCLSHRLSLRCGLAVHHDAGMRCLLGLRLGDAGLASWWSAIAVTSATFLLSSAVVMKPRLAASLSPLVMRDCLKICTLLLRLELLPRAGRDPEGAAQTLSLTVAAKLQAP